MKKIIAAAACAVIAASALAACDARDGKVDDGRNGTFFNDETTASRNNTSRVTSSRTVYRDTDTDRGVLHDTASMVGEVGEDIAEGVGDIGSSVASNVSDAMHNDENDTNR